VTQEQSKSKNIVHKKMGKDKIDKRLVVHTIIREKEIWLDGALLQTCDGPFLNISDGVFIYLHRKDVKSLVLELQSEFPGSELVCEVFNYLWLKRALNGIVNFKMRKELHLG